MRISTKITGFFFSFTLLFSGKSRAEPLAPNLMPGVASQKTAESDEASSDTILQSDKLLAVRDVESPVDRAFNRMDKRRAKGQRYKYWYLLPLGIPQFNEGYRGMGAAFAVGQVGSVALYYDRMKKVNAGNSAATETTRGMTPQQAAQNPFVMAFLNSNEKQVKDAQKEQKYFLYSFIALYGLSVYETLYDPFDFRKIDALKKKRSRPERESTPDRDNTNKDRDDDESFEVTDEASVRPSNPRHNFGFMVLPAAKSSYQLALSWQTALP